MLQRGRGSPPQRRLGIQRHQTLRRLSLEEHQWRPPRHRRSRPRHRLYPRHRHRRHSQLQLPGCQWVQQPRHLRLPHLRTNRRRPQEHEARALQRLRVAAPQRIGPWTGACQLAGARSTQGRALPRVAPLRQWHWPPRLGPAQLAPLRRSAAPLAAAPVWCQPWRVPLRSSGPRNRCHPLHPQPLLSWTSRCCNMRAGFRLTCVKTATSRVS